jgi:hypothetical protein
MLWSLASPLFAILAQRVSGQAFHTVVVGDSGSFYDPPTISALVSVKYMFESFNWVSHSFSKEMLLPLFSLESKFCQSNLAE